MSGLKDKRVAARIQMRLDRLADGNPGDVKPMGSGVSELRVDVGAGYRVYQQRGDVLIVLLCGGDKSTQQRDIERAYRIAKDWRGHG